MNHWYKYAAIFLLLLSWHIATVQQFVSPLFLPDLIHLWQAIQHLALSGSLVSDIGHTALRALVGLCIAGIIGIPLGLVMGHSKKAHHFFAPLIDSVRSIPVTALFPLFFLLFGIGSSSTIAVVIWTCVTVLAVHAMAGVHGRSRIRMKAVETLNMSGFMLFRSVIFPEALPQIFGGMRIASSLSLVVTIVSEMFGGVQNGIGYRIMNAQLVYNIAEMYAAILVAGILGFILNALVVTIEKRAVHWKGK